MADADKVIIAAGGTGGHVFPALAVARELEARNVSVLWVGTERGIESSVVPEWGIPLRLVNVTALRGRGLMARVRSGITLLGAIGKSVRIILQERPLAVLGMGGYVAGPVCLAARLCGRRMVVHEQNAIAGFTNRQLKRIANKVMEAMPGTFAVSDHAVHTGNPVRADILSLSAPESRMAHRTDAVRILVIGGSQGAKALNEIVPLALTQVTTAVVVRHQCGEAWLTDTTEAYRDCPHGSEVLTFIDDMAETYAWADLILCRSGAMTVAELAAVGLPAILIPYPAAVDDHQTANGGFLVNAGAAIMIQESELTPDLLADNIAALISDRKKLVTMAQQGRAVSRRNATQNVVDEILGVAA